ncbi:hypothetical protein TRV_04186 [Trichophyton verrucosum HKI 0517]|uniref:Uncharacterized protein n=1 Tax=Trichophyton verrucosum (strain HKI 0517) TaxID=663202 RepID=D4DAN8_TRIVH|nr:uncharacterized protein TRV_04186 [Trichophyton verrucosum HKI 0517]EFE41057.1 hypothetical protein TRV_04186 [Trichophyton verrucosum HKI 0517]
MAELVKDIEKDGEKKKKKKKKKKLRRREARSLFVLYRANSCVRTALNNTVAGLPARLKHQAREVEQKCQTGRSGFAACCLMR